MPKRKRWNVPFKRKQRKSTPTSERSVYITNVTVCDHSYCVPYDKGEGFETVNNDSAVNMCTDDINIGDGETEEVFSTCVNDSSGSDMYTFEVLKREVLEDLKFPYTYNPSANDDVIQIIELYPTSAKTSVKLSAIIDKNYHAKVIVHQIQLSATHDFWIGLPSAFDNLLSIRSLLSKLSSWSVCIGNCDEEYQGMIPVGSAIQSNEQVQSLKKDVGYREGDFGVIQGNTSYNSTIRSMECELLVNGVRCSFCSHLRRILYNRKIRQEAKRRKSDGEEQPNYFSKSYKHCFMSKDELIGKISQQNQKIRNLQIELNCARRQFQTLQKEYFI